MNDLMQLSADSMLDAVAAREPTPGGGCVAGLAGALSTAMSRMVAAYSTNKKTDPSTAEFVATTQNELQRLDQLLRATVSMDAKAYEEMTAIAKDKGRDSSEYAQSVVNGAMVPLEIVLILSQVLKTVSEFKANCNPYLISDLGVASILASASAHAASLSVRINLPEIKDETLRDKLSTRLATLLKDVDTHAHAIDAYIQQEQPNLMPTSK